MLGCHMLLFFINDTAPTEIYTNSHTHSLPDALPISHEAGGAATNAQLDLTDGDSIARLASAMAERWQQLDMLVLNAAMLGTLTPVAAIDGKEFNKTLTLNLIAQQDRKSTSLNSSH